MADDANTMPAQMAHALWQERQRQLLEAAAEALLGAAERALAALDALDGDPDFEPCLGAPERHPHAPQQGGPFVLRSAAAEPSQAEWAQGSPDERENDGDDREPDDWGWEAPDGGTAYPSAAGAWPPRAEARR